MAQTNQGGSEERFSESSIIEVLKDEFDELLADEPEAEDEKHGDKHSASARERLEQLREAQRLKKVIYDDLYPDLGED